MPSLYSIEDYAPDHLTMNVGLIFLKFFLLFSSKTPLYLVFQASNLIFSISRTINTHVRHFFHYMSYRNWVLALKWPWTWPLYIHLFLQAFIPFWKQWSNERLNLSIVPKFGSLCCGQNRTIFSDQHSRMLILLLTYVP